MIQGQKRISTANQFLRKDQGARELESQNIRKEPLNGMFVHKDQRLDKK
jgi:hypothetical protein